MSRKFEPVKVPTRKREAQVAEEAVLQERDRQAPERNQKPAARVTNKQ
jgi:hypothetical protein